MILYSRSGAKTAKRFAENFLIERFRSSRIVFLTEDPLISWGATNVETDENHLMYNKPQAIKDSSNKELARQLLFDAGVPVPTPGYDIFPCVGRTRYHKGGKGFWLCDNLEEVEKAKKEGAKYFSAFYAKIAEYRVHVAHGATLLVQEKVPMMDLVGDLIRANPIWNHANFNFVVIRQNLWKKRILRDAIKAVEVLGLDFGAVDVLANDLNTDQPHVISEVNTAPGLAPYSLHKYVQYFQWLLDNKPTEHFVVNSEKKADYVLTNLMEGGS